MLPAPLKKTASGLVAANRSVRLVLSPVGDRPISGNGLLEETECNLLVRRLRGRGDLRLEIDGQNARDLGFLRQGRNIWGRLNTGDRPGRIRLRVLLDGEEALCTELDVRPAKLDYETHFQAMRANVESACRALAYAPARAARFAVSPDKGDATPLDFLQAADACLVRLCRLLRAILKQPDRRLATQRVVRPVSLARGDDPDAIAFLIRTPSAWTPLPERPSRLTPLTAGNRRIGYTSIQETRRHPTTNTPTNRHLVAALNRIHRRARYIAQDIGHTPDATHYRDLCDRIRTRLNHILHAPPLRDVPPAAPGDPLPVNIHTRYTMVLSLCRELMQALAPCCGGPLDLSYRDTPTLYEYWTWLTLTRTFIDLGFSPAPGTADRLLRFTAHGLTVRPMQGRASAIHLRGRDCSVRILYNPTYTTRKGRSVTHDLRPDIVVEIQHKKGARTVHAFDAKYRREWHPVGSNDGDDGFWTPLRDDIDKMHAYRDAIGQVSPAGFERTLRSAVVLYPAPQDPRYHSHRFYRSLPHGIGGLPLLPGDADTLMGLRNYLARHLVQE